MRGRRAEFRDGFTLLELVLVMLIISIAMAIIVPSLGNATRGARVGDAAAQIVSLCNYARAQAIAEGRPYRLNFGTGAYWLTAQDGGQFVDLQTEYGQHYTLADDLRIQTDLSQSEDGTYVTFGSNGRADPTPVNVQINDNAGGSSQIVCESATELFHVVEKSRQ